MKHTIAEKPNGLQIEVSDIEGRESDVLAAFQECQEGKCSCPTQEYTKLEALKVEQAAGTITLRMKAKNGQQLDQSEIERCLDHTDSRTSQG